MTMFRYTAAPDGGWGIETCMHCGETFAAGPGPLSDWHTCPPIEINDPFDDEGWEDR